jgi:hypothetical protein
VSNEAQVWIWAILVGLFHLGILAVLTLVCLFVRHLARINRHTSQPGAA